MDREVRKVRIDSLIPFKYHSGQTITSERLQMMMDSIQRSGLLNPIIVRPLPVKINMRSYADTTAPKQ